MRRRVNFTYQIGFVTIMRTQPAGRVVRQKKLNRSTHQQILREDQIESAEYDSLQGQYKVETGVEKAEENVSNHVSLMFIVSRDICE